MNNIPKQDIDKITKLHPHAYRTMAYAYLCSAEALVRQFGFNTELGVINFAINPSKEEEIKYSGSRNLDHQPS